MKTYFRPATLGDAIALLSNPDNPAIPLGGGVVVSKLQNSVNAVVDLQDLGLTTIKTHENVIRIGSATPLEQIVQFPGLSEGLKESLLQECSFNLRQQATLTGTLLTADGRSPAACAFLALDTRLLWQPENKFQTLENLYQDFQKPGVLVTEISYAQPENFVYDMVARSPKDRPIVQVAQSVSADGFYRLALGGWGSRPRLGWVGRVPENWQTVISDALSNAGDAWASSDYRRSAAVYLIERGLARLGYHS